MDVILLKDVEQLGAAGTIVRVKPGFARNYLIPYGIAAPATPGQRASMQEAVSQRAQKAGRIRAKADALKRRLEGRSLTLRLRLGKDDKPFGSITTHEVLEGLRTEGFELDKHALQLEEPIKALGIYEVPVRLHPEISATLKLWVVKE